MKKVFFLHLMLTTTSPELASDGAAISHDLKRKFSGGSIGEHSGFAGHKMNSERSNKHLCTLSPHSWVWLQNLWAKGSHRGFHRSCLGLLSTRWNQMKS